jgi:predicted AAA+ superfamily ATPase
MAALEDTPVVFIQGPRQSGKTTLAQSLRDQGYLADYRTLDDAPTLAAAYSDPDGFVAGLPDHVILDEVQRAPDLLRAIKASVDRRRKPGRFLLTGSAYALTLPRVSESLAGRMEVVSLWPFSQGEIEGRVEGFVDSCFGTTCQPARMPVAHWPDLVERIVRGGYPEAVGRDSADRRDAWFRSYEMTILERDVRDIASVQGLRDMPRLLRLAALRTASLLNVADLARDAAMPHTTFQRYWALFEATFLLCTLPAWAGNLGTRLVKAPKVMPVDSGLLCWLLGLDTQRLQAGELMAGAVLEAFVANEIMRQIPWSKTRPGLFHYRSHTHQEVDLVLENRRGQLVGIEVKKTGNPKGEDFKGLRHLREQAGKRFLRGILLYTGAESVAFGPDLYALPVSALWRLDPGTAS